MMGPIVLCTCCVCVPRLCACLGNHHIRRMFSKEWAVPRLGRPCPRWIICSAIVPRHEDFLFWTAPGFFVLVRSKIELISQHLGASYYPAWLWYEAALSESNLHPIPSPERKNE